MSACFGTSHLTPRLPRPVLGLPSLSSLTSAAGSARQASSVSLRVITVKTMRPKLPQSLPSTQQGPSKPLIPSCLPLRWGAWEPVLLRGREEQGESQGAGLLPGRMTGEEQRDPHGQQLASLAASTRHPSTCKVQPLCVTLTVSSRRPQDPQKHPSGQLGAPLSALPETAFLGSRWHSSLPLV